MNERELTKTEFKKVMDAAIAALPADSSDNGIIIFVVANTDKGAWVNRCSNLTAESSNMLMERYMGTQDLFNFFGTPDKN